MQNFRMFVMATYSLMGREIIRFYRQPGRIIGTLAMPVGFWLGMGGGLGTSFQTSGVVNSGHYLTYLLPGILTMVTLFTAIFSTISIIEDRQSGFLQAALVAPVPRATIALAKMSAGMCISLLQCLPMLLLARFMGMSIGLGALGLILLVLAILGLTLTALGLLIAWESETVQSYHSVMNVFLMPLWALSGALFPIQGAAWPIAWLIRINPLTYAGELLRVLLFHPAPLHQALYGLTWNWLITLALLATLLGASLWQMNRPYRWG